MGRPGLDLNRMISMARKEMLHILRDRATLFFALFIPILQLTILGFAIDTNVRHVRTVICDHAGTQESRVLLQRFENSEDFRIVGRVFTDEALADALVSGRARVGIKVPENYSRQIQAGQTAQVLILVDGSDSSVAAEAVNVGNAIALQESLAHLLGGQPLPVDSRPRVLFNPDTRSPNFFLPGLMVVLSQIMAIMLSSISIVREKENGTLEQLFMTPVRAGEVILGKMASYLGLTFIEFLWILALMRLLFQVPIHGDVLTLLAMVLPFLLAMLGLGLLISTRVQTRDAAMQVAMGTVIPSIFLSGYIFPTDSMPTPFWIISQVIPATWMIDASRGVILRGAGWAELGRNAAILWVMAVLALVVSAKRFRKQLA
jgi:ABC-2 type transport system permease protein